MTVYGKENTYRIFWLLDECRNRECKLDVELQEEYGLITMQNSETKVEIYVFDHDKTDTKHRRYKLSIQTPGVILEMSTNNLNDIQVDLDRYAKGWRKCS